MSDKKLYLIDGNSYIYRAFYALPHLTNSRGIPTNAIYGFTNMLMKIIREERPDYLAVAFDTKGPTRRHTEYIDYKVHRPPMPDTLVPQIPYIHRMVDAFRIPVLVMEGVEADDIIGTVAHRAAQDGMEIIIISGDKDMFQLISERVRIYDTLKNRYFGIEDVKERFGTGPDGVVEVMGLMGDSSDNIPGVPGIGEKTARSLISEYGTIENLLSSVEKITKPKLKQNLIEHAGLARLSRSLATIQRDIELGLDYSALSVPSPDNDKLIPLLRELEFTSMLKMAAPPVPAGESKKVTTDADMDKIIQKINELGRFSFRIATEDGGIEAISISLDGDTCVMGSGWIDKMKALFEGETGKCGHDLKRDILLLRGAGLEMGDRLFDAMVASYLINPVRSEHTLEGISLEYIGRAVPSGNRCSEAEAVAELVPVLLKRLEDEGLIELFNDLEMPLVKVLARMEERGVLVDRGFLASLSSETEGDLQGIMTRIYALAGEEFNINSPKQLSEILFEKLKLPAAKKTKTGYSTDVEVLQQLTAVHELPAEILAYRTLSKLKSTYIDSLPTMINSATGRVHTSLNQTITATGRLSSSEPNLQNIPIRTELGKRIREAFIAEPGNLILSADYSQIELRVLAHMSGDRILIESFMRGEDIHSRTASEVFGIMPGLVTQEMRRMAKVVNFGIIYGMSPFGLAKDLGIPQKEAKRYIDAYFERYSGVREFLDRTVAEAREKGHVRTILGRKRPIPELSARDAAVRQFGERTAVNSPIQGTAADIIKLSMIRIDRRLAVEGLRTSMILQVHDELVFEVPEQEMEQVNILVREEMEGAMSLNVPLKVDIGSGKNWREAH